MTLSLQQIWDNAAAAGKSDFLVTSHHRISYADTTQAIQKLCAVFDQHGLKRGDRIVICSTNEFAVTLTFLAALLDGIVPTNLAADAKQARVTKIIAETGCRLFITDATIAQTWDIPCATLHTQAMQKPRLLFRAAKHSWPFDIAPTGSRDPSLPDDRSALAYLLFTSGSVAAPSGVMLSLGNLLANLETVGDVLQIGRGDRPFVDLPLAHTDGLIHGPVLSFARQAAVIRNGSFSLNTMEQWLNAVRRQKCTHFMAVPYIYSLICRYAAHSDYFDAPELKMLISSAGRIDPALWDDIENRFGKPVVNEYGMTETVMAACHAGAFDGMGAPKTLGLSAHCETRVLALSPDAPDTGELQLRGPNICLGYWNNPDRTTASFDDDGWFGTGDIVQRRADGSYDLIGRSKSMINSAGFSIAPDEIDEALCAHTDVAFSVTVGHPDPQYGEIAISVVESTSHIEVETLLTMLRTRLEALKVPKDIIIVDSLPRGTSGKPEFQKIKDIVAQNRATTPEPQSSGAPNQNDVTCRVLNIAAQTFGCDVNTLTLVNGPDDILGWDSFSQVNFILALEDEFSVQLSARQITSIRTLGDALAHVAG